MALKVQTVWLPKKRSSKNHEIWCSYRGHEIKSYAKNYHAKKKEVEQPIKFYTKDELQTFLNTWKVCE